jgi:hypothetical protein
MRRPRYLSPRATAPVRARESGSAYIVVLLVLVVLTVLGLSLALVTQTERQIGASEKTVQRVFATAESGIALAVAKAMVLDDNGPMALEFREPRARLDGTGPSLAGDPLALRHDLEVSVLLPLLDSPCHLCQINSGGNTDIPYSNINHGVVSTATRRGWSASGDADDAQVIGRQRVSAMVQIQPIEGITDPLFLSDEGQRRSSGRLELD